MLTLLNFTTADLRFALGVEQIVKVIPLVSLGPIPGARAWVVGMMDVDGASMIVFDLAVRLDLPDRTPYSTASSIVICRQPERNFGFVVNHINGIESLAEGALMRDETLSGDGMPYRGVYLSAKFGRTLLLRLDHLFDQAADVRPPPAELIEAVRDDAPTGAESGRP